MRKDEEERSEVAGKCYFRSDTRKQPTNLKMVGKTMCIGGEDGGIGGEDGRQGGEDGLSALTWQKRKVSEYTSSDTPP